MKRTIQVVDSTDVWEILPVKAAQQERAGERAREREREITQHGYALERERAEHTNALVQERQSAQQQVTCDI